MGHKSSALKFAYKAQSCLLSVQSADRPVPIALDLAVNLLTFVLLWKVKKYHEAYSYAQIASNRLRLQSWRTEESYRNYLSVTAVLAMAAAGCYLKVENEPEKAIKTLEDVLVEMQDWEVPAARLVSDMKSDLQRLVGDSEASEYTSEVSGNFLASSDYTALVFITLFIPLISTAYLGPATPLIRRSDLEAAKRKERSNKDQSDEFLRLISTEADPYSIVMTSVLAAAKPSRSSTPLPLSSSPVAARMRKYRRKIAGSKDLSQGWISPRLGRVSELSIRPEDVGKYRSKRTYLPLLRKELRTTLKRNLGRDFQSVRGGKGSESAPVRLQPLVPRAHRKRPSGLARSPVSRSIQIERQVDISISPQTNEPSAEESQPAP